MDAVTLNGVYKIYKEGDIETVALRNTSLQVQTGEFVAITGRSGSGKSTLLSLLGGLTLPSAGKVSIAGTELARLTEGQRTVFRRDHIGIVYQGDNLIPFLSALENVLLPMRFAGRADSRKRAATLLNELGLSARMHHRPGMLSGGERQRVAIAVALANDPTLLLADELTGELDTATADQVMNVLKTMNSTRQITLIIVTHNPLVAARAQRQMQLADGELSETTTPAVHHESGYQYA